MNCIKCGTEVTHHHKYCEEHYPQKSATILSLKTRVSALHRTVKSLLYNYPSQNISKKALKTELLSRKITSIDGIKVTDMPGLNPKEKTELEVQER